MFVVTDRPALQPSFLGFDEPTVNVRFAGAQRTWLDESSWVEVVPGWLTGADRLFEDLANSLPWQQRTVPMFDRMVIEPRLVWWWQAGSGSRLPSPLLTDMRMLLSIRYGKIFDSIGANYYRSGRDSVAWHRDRLGCSGDAAVAIVSTGAPRPFLVRPRGGGVSRAFLVGHGDLLTLGGLSNEGWEHQVPKVAQAGPRISLVFRHDSTPHEQDVTSDQPDRARLSRSRHLADTRHRHPSYRAFEAELSDQVDGS